MNKSLTLEEILPNGRGVWIPIDHGVSDYPVSGLENLEQLITDLIAAEVDVIIAHKGVVSYYNHLCEGTKTKMVIHLSASTTHGGEDSNNKVLVGDAKEAVKRGAVGVSCQVNTGSIGEREMIKSMGKLSKQANKLDIPMFGMVYARGENLNVQENDKTKGYAHAARLAFELGCDAAKTVWTGDKESFATICSSVPIPLLVAGGPSTGDAKAILTMVKDALDCGAAGVCMGRQVFGHEKVKQLAKALTMLVHQNKSVTEAMEACSL